MKLLTPVTRERPPVERRPENCPKPTAPPRPTPVPGDGGIGFTDLMATAFFASLASELRLPCDDGLPFDDVIRAYGTDIDRLHRAAEEADRFLCSVLDHYLSGTADPVVRSERMNVLRRALPPLPRPANILSAEFLARDNDLARDLAAGVRTATAQLVVGVVATLHALAASRVCGRIDWPRADLCRFTYFEESITRTVTKTRKRNRKKGHPSSDTSDGRTIVRVDTVTDTETTTDRCRWTQHEHHLADATIVAPVYARWVIPTPVIVLMTSAPTWIRRQLLIVEGTRIVERTLIWETTRSSSRVVEERDVPVYAPDPALTLGEFVLAGWSEPENQTDANPVLSVSRALSPTRSVLWEYAGLGGAALTILLAADAAWRLSTGTAWYSAIAAVATAVVTAGVFASTSVRGTTASDTIPSTVDSNARGENTTHER